MFQREETPGSGKEGKEEERRAFPYLVECGGAAQAEISCEGRVGRRGRGSGNGEDERGISDGGERRRGLYALIPTGVGEGGRGAAGGGRLPCSVQWCTQAQAQAQAQARERKTGKVWNSPNPSLCFCSPNQPG